MQHNDLVRRKKHYGFGMTAFSPRMIIGIQHHFRFVIS